MCQGCGWELGSDLMVAYHNERWCKPEHDDRELFALLVLEGMQAGLSWQTVINKEAAFREAFHGFDPVRVAAFGEDDVARLMGDARIIRSERKIRAAVSNARAFLEVQRTFGSFDAYLWAFVDGCPVDHRLTTLADMPAKDELSERVSKDLKRRGFSFVGPVIVYSYLQAAGLINDHLLTCSYR